MRYEARLQAACLEHPSAGTWGSRSGGGRPAGGERASSLGSGGGAPAPHSRAFSRRDFTTAGRERGQGTGPARPDGTRFACRGVSHLGHGWGCDVLRVPVGQGDGGLESLYRAKGEGWGRGWMGAGGPPGSQPKVPCLLSWEGGQKAVVKPDVCWTSLAEQVGRDGGTLAELMPAIASQPPAVTFQSWT